MVAWFGLDAGFQEEEVGRASRRSMPDATMDGLRCADILVTFCLLVTEFDIRVH